jgi:hypothetical protein
MKRYNLHLIKRGAVHKANRCISLLAVTILIMLGAFQGTSQISVSLHLPPPGSFTPEDFIHLISFQNPTGQVREVYLKATVEELSGGLIFSGSTTIFEVMPGYSTPHYTTYEPVEVDYINPVYEQFILKTNSLPSGEYVVCVMVIDGITEDQLSMACVPHSIFQPSAPMLIYPPDEATVSEPSPLFSWLPPTPMPEIDIHYQLKIWEVLPGQDAQEAIVTNPAQYEHTIITGTHHPYPLAAPLFTRGMRYTWQIRAVTEEGIPVGMQEGFSETGVFNYGDAEIREIIVIAPVAPCVGQVTSEITSMAGEFQWQAIGNFTAFQVVVSANPCGRLPDKPSKPSTPSTPPREPDKPRKPPGTPPQRTDTVTRNPVADSIPKKPGGGYVETPDWKPDTTGGGVTVTPVGGGLGVTDWPDEGEVNRPALPPGWAWGEYGPYWTGEHPPEPPALPPGWEWGPLRPVWAGEGTPPPERIVLGVSETVIAINSATPSPTPGYYSVTMPLHEILQPGQAFVYQISGIFEDSQGEPKAYLSEPQCLRYSAVAEGNEKAQPLACDPCMVSLKPDAAPKMDGGLEPQQETMEIFRDEFITLKAVGADYDEIWWYCNPKPLCPETASKEMRITNGRVKFSWKITSGEGLFVEIGCSGGSKSKTGDRTIFMPPYVKPGDSHTTQIELLIIDDNPTQPADETVKKMVTIKTERTLEKPNHYKISITSDPYQLPAPAQITGLIPGSCKAMGPEWKLDQNLRQPEIQTPAGNDSRKLVYKEWIRLHANDIRDPDQVKVWCIAEKCSTNQEFKKYEDAIEFEWSIKKGGGRFIKGNKGRYVVYEAPEDPGEVQIEVKIRNPDGMKIVDQQPPAGSITLQIFQPGVRMDTTRISWLPTADTTKVIEKLSYLVYKKGDVWKPALEHQCRIHFVQLIDISNEPGICMNWPFDNDFGEEFVDTCKDLTIKKTNQYELWDTVTCERWGCNGEETWFGAATSKKPVKEMRVQVVSWDYGSYGFVRSVANGDGTTKKPYESVGWKEKEYKHPVRGHKKREYTDNRVTVPRDADENRIADGGYYTSVFSILAAGETSREHHIEKVKINDEREPTLDADDRPHNSNKGDGLSCYEEYRGVKARTKHERLSPEQKNLLIHDRNFLGTGSFGNSGIRAVLINENEMDKEDRAINKNRKTHTTGIDQPGTTLIEDPELGANGSSGYADSIGLDVCPIVHVAPWVRLEGQVWVNYVVAHELSHAVGVWHHGEGNIWGYLPPGQTVRINGRDSTNNTSENIWFKIMKSGGVSSGDQLCWMRYFGASQYCLAPGEPHNYPQLPVDASANLILNIAGWRLVRRDDMVKGTTITNSTAGSGINRSGGCGQNAASGRGDCINQIKIKSQP